MQILESVNHCHQNGVVHRDLKVSFGVRNLPYFRAELYRFRFYVHIKVAEEVATFLLRISTVAARIMQGKPSSSARAPPNSPSPSLTLAQVEPRDGDRASSLLDARDKAAAAGAASDVLANSLATPLGRGDALRNI